jgi:DNA-directed RNA polymerase subunit K/omega
MACVITKTIPHPSYLQALSYAARTLQLRRYAKPSHNTRETLTALVEIADSVILWARDHPTYRAIIDEMEAQADVRRHLQHVRD